jgi:putative ABC transport system permease protein
MRLTRWIDELWNDVRFAVRQLWRAPAFAVVATITLALGIGANSAIFALVDATLLRPLPFPAADRLVMAWEQTRTAGLSRVAPPNLIDWNDRSRAFEGFAGFRPTVGGMVMNGADGKAETVSRQWVTSGFFSVLGVNPVAGRTFLPSDNQNQVEAVVLSEAFWEARFGRDPSVIGRPLRLDGDLYTVVGVVPKDFQLSGRSSIWALLHINRDQRFRTAYAFNVVGRMKPGVTLDAANADMTAIAAGLAREFPKTNEGRGVALQPMHRALVGSELRLTSMLFLGVVGIVLLICCANVANLLLARATVRTRELAIRSALGAHRGRVIRQLLTESLVLSAIGGGLGVWIGAAILSVAPSIVPEGLLPAAVTLTFDARVVTFCAAATVIVGVLFGLAPAWQATEFSSAQVIGADSRTTTGRGGKLRGGLVAAEVATAVLLLFGAGLLLRTLIAVETIDRGYRAERVLTMYVDPLGSKYPTEASLMQFYDEVEREITALPGVRGVAWTNALPLDGTNGEDIRFEIAGDPPRDERQRPSASYQVVSPNYFRTLELPIVSGRAFTARDTSDGVQVCLVSEAFVRAHLKGRSPIGVRLALRGANSNAPPRVKEIVGVARQVKNRPDDTTGLVQIYVPMAQDLSDDMYLTVAPSAGRDGELLASSVRAAISSIDKEQLVSVRSVMTLEDVAWEATGRHRFRAVLVITFAGLALLLSMVGVFGVLAYSVQQRVRDFAVRRALGASTRDVIRLVVGDAVRVVVTGAAIGLILSAALSRMLTTILFGVQPLDPLTFTVVVVLLALTAALSIAGPAWRATRIDPAVALRGK